MRVGPDHRHLVDQNGSPYLIQGDAPWSLISGLTKEEAEQYLDKRQSQGFNSIIVNLIEHKFRGPVSRLYDEPRTVRESHGAFRRAAGERIYVTEYEFGRIEVFDVPCNGLPLWKGKR